jgi:tRNA pseudouridine38-40 synthase
LAVCREGERVTITVTANAFLHHMVRNIAGLLISVGRGDTGPDFAAEVLASRDRTRNAATAPADGLYFVAASYPREFAVPVGVSAMIPL